ncbi:MAG TPA: DoxX family protein [Blastocatellia bacterium]|nr:DoxX family protein [Blastocatellia bacterium]
MTETTFRLEDLVRGGKTRLETDAVCPENEGIHSDQIAKSIIRRTKTMNIALWIIQIILAGLFLFSGIVKLVIPIQEMAAQINLPGLFLRFVAVLEILGALGLILPGLLKIMPRLTSLAAAGLVIIMIGAVAISVRQGVADAVLPALTGILAAFVAYGRLRLAPLG